MGKDRLIRTFWSGESKERVRVSLSGGPRIYKITMDFRWAKSIMRHLDKIACFLALCVFGASAGGEKNLLNTFFIQYFLFTYNILISFFKWKIKKNYAHKLFFCHWKTVNFMFFIFKSKWNFFYDLKLNWR